MILLVDMDAFFASVEQQLEPRLRGRPVIVCGDPRRRGVVTAASYEARPFGVRSGMPLAEARRLCPQAAYVEGRPDTYVAVSLRLLDLYLSFTPDVEPFSVDEAFLGLTGSRDTPAQADAVARRIQDAIAAEFELGATIGIGPNKLIAKMASGVRKPRGLTRLDPGGFRRYFWPLPARELWGVGPQLESRLAALGINTIGDLAAADPGRLRDAFGVIGPQLIEAASGRDVTPLLPWHQGVDPKSMGHEITLERDCDDPGFLEGMLLRLCDQVGRRLRAEGFVGRVVTLKLRDARFVTRMRQGTLPAHTADHLDLHRLARRLLLEQWDGRPLRLIGVTASQLERAAAGGQSELFHGDERRRRLERALDRVRDRLGEASVVPAGSLAHRRRLGHVPFGGRGRTARGSR